MKKLTFVLLTVIFLIGVRSAAQEDITDCTGLTLGIDLWRHTGDDTGITNINFTWSPGAAAWHRLKIWSMATWEQLVEEAFKGDLGYLMDVTAVDVGVGDYLVFLIAENSEGEILCYTFDHFTLDSVYRPPVLPPTPIDAPPAPLQPATVCPSLGSAAEATNQFECECNGWVWVEGENTCNLGLILFGYAQ